MPDNASAYASGAYDGHIESVLPYYREYHAQIIALARAAGLTSPDWLDTGCGTGTLALRALEAFPGARLTLCDPSEQMLGEARRKLAGRDVRFERLSSQELPFEAEFDAVTAVMCHHYLQPEERELAVRRCFAALRPSGLFVAFEHIRMSTPESDAIALKGWVRFLEAQGNPPEEVAMQLERRGAKVLPVTAEEHLALLRRCGFRSANVLWASCLQAGFWAVK